MGVDKDGGEAVGADEITDERGTERRDDGRRDVVEMCPIVCQEERIVVGQVSAGADDGKVVHLVGRYFLSECVERGGVGRERDCSRVLAWKEVGGDEAGIEVIEGVFARVGEEDSSELFVNDIAHALDG